MPNQPRRGTTSMSFNVRNHSCGLLLHPHKFRAWRRSLNIQPPPSEKAKQFLPTLQEWYHVIPLSPISVGTEVFLDKLGSKLFRLKKEKSEVKYSCLTEPRVAGAICCAGLPTPLVWYHLLNWTPAAASAEEASATTAAALSIYCL